MPGAFASNCSGTTANDSPETFAQYVGSGTNSNSFSYTVPPAQQPFTLEATELVPNLAFRPGVNDWSFALQTGCNEPWLGPDAGATMPPIPLSDGNWTLNLTRNAYFAGLFGTTWLNCGCDSTQTASNDFDGTVFTAPFVLWVFSGIVSAVFGLMLSIGEYYRSGDFSCQFGRGRPWVASLFCVVALWPSAWALLGVSLDAGITQLCPMETCSVNELFQVYNISYLTTGVTATSTPLTLPTDVHFVATVVVPLCPALDLQQWDDGFRLVATWQVNPLVQETIDNWRNYLTQWAWIWLLVPLFPLLIGDWGALWNARPQDLCGPATPSIAPTPAPQTRAPCDRPLAHPPAKAASAEPPAPVSAQIAVQVSAARNAALAKAGSGGSSLCAIEQPRPTDAYQSASFHGRKTAELVAVRSQTAAPSNVAPIVEASIPLPSPLPFTVSSTPSAPEYEFPPAPGGPLTSIVVVLPSR